MWGRVARRRDAEAAGRALGAGEKASGVRSLSSAAEAGTENKLLIAAVNRCAPKLKSNIELFRTLFKRCLGDFGRSLRLLTSRRLADGSAVWGGLLRGSPRLVPTR